MKCFFSHKFIDLKGNLICERCGKLWFEGVEKKEKPNNKPAVILTKETDKLKQIFNDKTSKQ